MTKVDLRKTVDLRKADWTVPISGSSNGILPKTVLNINKSKTYVKLGSYSLVFGVYGKEPLIELINSRIGEILELPVLQFGLIKCAVILDGKTIITLASISKEFKQKSENSISIEKWYSKFRLNQESPLDTCRRYKLQSAIYKEFLYDYIICNLDRHSKNTELIFGKNNIRVAPFFDNSLTFMLNRPENEITAKVKYNDSMKVNNFIGTMNLRDNLYLIDSIITARTPTKEDRQRLFQGLSSVTTRQFRDYIWDMLNWRVSNVKQEKLPFIQWR